MLNYGIIDLAEQKIITVPAKDKTDASEQARLAGISKANIRIYPLVFNMLVLEHSKTSASRTANKNPSATNKTIAGDLQTVLIDTVNFIKGLSFTLDEKETAEQAEEINLYIVNRLAGFTASYDKQNRQQAISYSAKGYYETEKNNKQASKEKFFASKHISADASNFFSAVSFGFLSAMKELNIDSLQQAGNKYIELVNKAEEKITVPAVLAISKAGYSQLNRDIYSLRKIKAEQAEENIAELAKNVLQKTEQIEINKLAEKAKRIKERIRLVSLYELPFENESIEQYEQRKQEKLADYKAMFTACKEQIKMILANNEIIDNLSDIQKQIVSLLFIGYGASDICLKLHCSRQNIYKHLFTIRKKAIGILQKLDISIVNDSTIILEYISNELNKETGEQEQVKHHISVPADFTQEQQEQAVYYACGYLKDRNTAGREYKENLPFYYNNKPVYSIPASKAEYSLQALKEEQEKLPAFDKWLNELLKEKRLDSLSVNYKRNKEQRKAEQQEQKKPFTIARTIFKNRYNRFGKQASAFEIMDRKQTIKQRGTEQASYKAGKNKQFTYTEKNKPLSVKTLYYSVKQADKARQERKHNEYIKRKERKQTEQALQIMKTEQAIYKYGQHKAELEQRKAEQQEQKKVNVFIEHDNTITSLLANTGVIAELIKAEEQRKPVTITAEQQEQQKKEQQEQRKAEQAIFARQNIVFNNKQAVQLAEQRKAEHNKRKESKKERACAR